MIEVNFVYLLILGNLKWQALAWPLKLVDAADDDYRMMRWVLDSSSSCQWLQCSLNMPAFQTKLVWSNEFGIHWQQVGPPETFAQNCLRRSNGLTFTDLCLMGRHLFGSEIKEKSRKDILLKLALHFGDDFAELVLECDSKTTKKSSSDPDQAALVKAVFDHLDADEQKEFRSVKENVYREEKTQKQLKWRKLLNEKMEEQAATWMIKMFNVAGLASLFQLHFNFSFFSKTGMLLHLRFFHFQEKAKKKAAKGKGKSKGKGKVKGRSKGKGRSGRGSGKGAASSSGRKRKREAEEDDERPGKEASDAVKMEDEEDLEEEEAQVNFVNSGNCVNSDVEDPLPNPGEANETERAEAAAELAEEAAPPAELAEEAAPAAEVAEGASPSEVAEGAPPAELAEAAAPAAELAEAAAPAAELAPPAQPAEPARPAPVPGRDVGPRVHSTPALLRSIEPNSWFKLRLDKNAHRFQVEMDKNRTVQHELWDSTQRQMYYSRSFKATGDWKTALQEVHTWMWEKFVLAGLELGPGIRDQIPGEVPDEVFEGLKDEMRALPPPRNYNRRK